MMAGAYAVFCFYMMSGYLMSKIINEVYIDKSGPFRYMANRLLRIYPLYLTVLLLTIAVIPFISDLGSVQLGNGPALGVFMWLPEQPQD